jgi:hypothetical protein
MLTGIVGIGTRHISSGYSFLEYLLLGRCRLQSKRKIDEPNSTCQDTNLKLLVKQHQQEHASASQLLTNLKSSEYG